MDALNSGRIDGASTLIELAMKSKQKGSNIKAVALGHHEGNVIMGQKGMHLNEFNNNGDDYHLVYHIVIQHIIFYLRNYVNN